MSATLTFDDVSKWYGDTVAVASLSFSLSPGVTGLLGHNGAGKSTALKLCAGFATPSLGKRARARGRIRAASPRSSARSASSRTWTGCGRS